MKTIIKAIITFVEKKLYGVLSDRKSYRQRKGGTWYQLKCNDTGSLVDGQLFWQQEEPGEEDIVYNKECYSSGGVFHIFFKNLRQKNN